MSGDRKASLSVKKHRQLRKLEIGKVFLVTSGSGKPRLEIDWLEKMDRKEKISF